MQDYEDSTLTFDLNVPTLFKDLDYDMIVRYEHLPNHPNQWEDVKVELIRVDGLADPEGRCKDANDGPISMSLPSTSPDGSTLRFNELPEQLCLEEGQRYQIKLTFDQYDANTDDPSASILVDSVGQMS